VLDNLSAHKTHAVEAFLLEHPKVRFHFTLTYSSWLNQVELWFARSSGMSLLAVCLHPSRIWHARFANTSGRMLSQPNRSDGLIQIQRAESNVW
jgi:hypothetical protein